jgi:hypothetical protein
VPLVGEQRLGELASIRPRRNGGEQDTAVVLDESRGVLLAAQRLRRRLPRGPRARRTKHVIREAARYAFDGDKQ